MKMFKNNQGISLILVAIVIAVISLLLRIAIEQIIRINIAQNESSASANLKIISAALENYARDHKEAYPEGISGLIQAKPPYLDKDYTGLTSLKGYSYSCFRLEPASYSCSAYPLKCRLSGEKIFTVTSGGLLTSEECSKKE